MWNLVVIGIVVAVVGIVVISMKNEKRESGFSMTFPNQNEILDYIVSFQFPENGTFFVSYDDDDGSDHDRVIVEYVTIGYRARLVSPLVPPMDIDAFHRRLRNLAARYGSHVFVR